MKAGGHLRRTAGFTLIELLIAVSLTVMVGAISYRFLDAAIRVDALGSSHMQSVSDLEQTWQLLARDLRGSTDRPVTVPATGTDVLPASAPVTEELDGRQRRPSMISAMYNGVPLTQIVSREGALLWFTRSGWENPLQQSRSGLQRILYRLDNNGTLYRDYWSEKNQPISAQPDGSLLLLENVQSLQFEFLARGDDPDADDWQLQWPPAVTAVSQSEADAGQVRPPLLPAAVRVTVYFSGEVPAQNTQPPRSERPYQRLFLAAY